MKIKNSKSKFLLFICVSVILQTGCINKANKNESFINNDVKITSIKDSENTTNFEKTTTITFVTTSVISSCANNDSQVSTVTTNPSSLLSKLTEHISKCHTEISAEIINPDLFTTAINTTSVISDNISKITSNYSENNYTIQTETSAPPAPTTESLITESEKVLLCNLVGREYGSDYHGNTNIPVTLYERGQVVAVVMNRVNNNEFPDNIYDVITQPNQFSGYLSTDTYSHQVTQSVIDSVDYYFEHTEYYSPDILYFEGDGSYNYFH